MGTINKLTKLVLSFLLVITCINFSIVQAEDGSDENYSEPTAVETISEEPASEPEQEVIPEEPVAEEPVIEEAAPVEEEKQEEVTPEVTEEAKVEEKNNIPEIEAEPATQEETVEPEVQQEAPVEPEVQKVETVEEVKVTVVVSYVDENDHPLTDPITGSYPIEYRLDENVDAFKSFDGYAFEKVIVNDDAKNTISKDDVQKNGFRITKDMTSLKLVYQKMNLESNESKEVIPEVTEEAVEEAEPESNTNETELSAFDQTAFAGKVGVHASAAEGVLPKGARLIVEQVNRKAILNAVENTVSDNNKEMDSAVALDISIVDKDGVEIQPNGVVNITFVNTGVSGDEVKIYHVEDDASAVTEIANNTESFDASHFSIYVITGVNEPSLTTFNFVANGNIVSTQTVKTGDTLITPTAPDMDGKVFVGWYDGETKFEDFNTALTISETTTREITAKYEDALYVYFYNPAGTQIMRTEKVSDHDTHDFTNVSYEVDATHKIVGWAAEKNGTTNIADSIAVPTDKTSINVYAIIKEGYWTSFDSDGGSIVDSQFVLHGDKLVLGKDTTPTKPGYTFDGWYNDSGKVENGATISSPMTLTAHWTPEKVSYTVIHWWENADDDGYSFHESETKKGLTGTEVNAKAKSYDGFTAQPVAKKTIKGDGSTIVSVYYKRNVYDVKFYSYSSWYTSSKEYTDLKITAKYGQDISKKWPTYKGSSTWRTNDGSGAYQVNIGTMPLGGAKFYGPKTGDEYETAYYYVEALPGEASDVTVSGIRYKLDHKDMSPGQGYYVTKEDQYPLKGYTFNEGPSTKIGKRYDGAKFYYTRNSYNLKFINNGKQDKTVSKKYEQSISSENYTPVRPGSLPDYYEFDGWYDNELCEGEAFDFNGKKMPAQNVTLYAKWTAKKINLTYNLNNPEGDVVKGSKNVEAGTIANTVLPSATTTSDYSFAGWYYADGNGNITSDAYNTNEAITKDTSVIGKWLYNGELKVVYDPGTEGTNAKVPTDSNIYAGGAKVTVAKNATTTSKKKFLGWKLNGNLYHPGDAFEVNKDLANNDNIITLTAIWGNEESSTTMSYNPGKGRGNVKTVPVKNNQSVTLKSEKDLGYQAPAAEGIEYYFAGWATSKDDANNGKATYAAGQNVHVDVDGENVLYATWIEKVVVEIKGKTKTETYNGNTHEVEGYDVTNISNALYPEEAIHFDGTAKASRKEEGTSYMGLNATQFSNTSANFTNVTFRVTDGWLKVTPKSIDPEDEKTGIQVTKPSDTMYNGEEQKNKPTVEDTKTGATLVENVDYTLSYTAAVNAGTVEVTITGIGNYTGTAKTSYEIIKRNVTLTSATASKPYDKTPLTNKNVTIAGFGFVKEEGATYNVTGSQTEKGTSKNTFTYELKSNTKASNYTIEVVYGDLTVTAEDGEVVVVITGRKDTFEYDGTVKSVKGYDVSITEGSTYLESDFTFSGNDEVKGTEAGTYDMGLKPEDFTNNNENYGNVTFRVLDGQLTIAPKSITPDGPDTPEEKKTGIEATDPADSIYDGKAHVNPFTVRDTKTGKDLVENKDYTLTYVGDVVNVGTVKVKVKGIGNYTGEFTKKYKITPREYTVTTESAEKPYDGTALTAGGKIEGIVDGEVVVVHTTGSQTDVGSTSNTYELEWKKASSKNYKLKEDSIGTLTVTEQTIDPGEDPEKPNPNYDGVTVNNPSIEVYDGKEHKWSPTVADKEENALVEGTDYEVAYSTEDFTNVTGTITVTITGIGNYTGTVTRTYEITKRDVVLTSATDSKPYDGTALRNENVEVTGDGFAAGEGATFAVTGTITNVGTKANTFGYALNKNTLASNYNISTELGTLTITPKSIIPDGPKTPEDKKTGITVENPGDVKYDGKDHAEKPVIKDEKTGVTLEEGKDYEIVYPEDIKNAGEITATVVGKGDYEGSFEIKYNITKRDVTFTSATDSKQYDGNALTNGNVEITGDGFIEGEGAEYKVIGTQTQVGNSANEFEYTLNENTLASNYDITKVVGTLTVTAAPAPETPEKPKPEVKKSVDTSDDNNIVFYGNAFFMAMITLAGIIVLRKKSS